MLETLASGYGLLEGPRVDAADNLFFSDVTNGGVYRRAPDGTVATVVPRRRGVGGIALHADGGVVVSGKNVCHVKDGQTRILFQRDDIPGFNDLFTDSAGRVYVGSLRSDPFKPGARVPGELWRLDGEGNMVQLYGDVGLTNGIGFSPDGRTLYHADSAAQHLIVHDVAPDGSCRNRRAISVRAVGGPDGIAVDEAGAIWVAIYDGGCVARFMPDGKLDRKIAVPAKVVTSLCFGGKDRRDLYIVTADNTEDPERKGTIFRTRVDVAGVPAPLARV
ncbi:MAG TPA: SMP-30/gluconolactonase/LRE family protein [Candidatus Binatia bacterium]|nr:SMP-30/gluconolactonase/LRE family protein [Candidatus Binatia bacterium]